MADRDYVRLTKVEDRVEALESRVMTVEQEIDLLTANLSRIDRDLAEIKGRLNEVATKADLHEQISGILGKALDSVPAKQGNVAVWTGCIIALISVVVAIVSLVSSFR